MSPTRSKKFGSEQELLGALINRVAFAGFFYRTNQYLQENKEASANLFEFCDGHFREEKQCGEVDYRIGFREGALHPDVPELHRLFLMGSFEKAKKYAEAKGWTENCTIMRLMFEKKCFKTDCFLRKSYLHEKLRLFFQDWPR